MSDLREDPFVSFAAGVVIVAGFIYISKEAPDFFPNLTYIIWGIVFLLIVLFIVGAILLGLTKVKDSIVFQVNKFEQFFRIPRILLFLNLLAVLPLIVVAILEKQFLPWIPIGVAAGSAVSILSIASHRFGGAVVMAFLLTHIWVSSLGAAFLLNPVPATPQHSEKSMVVAWLVLGMPPIIFWICIAAMRRFARTQNKSVSHLVVKDHI